MVFRYKVVGHGSRASAPCPTTKKLTPSSCFANLDFVTELFDSARQALRRAPLIARVK